MLGTGRKSDASSKTGLLLSLLVHRPAQLPAKVEAARQDRSARPGHVTPPGGSARLIHPTRRVEKYQPNARGGGAPRGGKVQTAEKRRTKMVPPPRRVCGGPRPPDPEASRSILVFHPLGDPKSEGGVRGGSVFSTPSLFGRTLACRVHSPNRHWLGVHAAQVHICPFPAFAKAMPRNPSFHARSPQMEKCLRGS